jgi:nucleotide-binding universal stress UspA family protein
MAHSVPPNRLMERVMKNVLVLMHDDAGQEARLQAALDLTRALDGHLTCLDVAVVPTVVIPAMDSFDGAAMVIADEKQRESDNRAKIEPRLRAEQVPYDWVDTTGFLSPAVCSACGLADLVVLNRELDTGYPDMRGVAGEVLITSGKPIIAVPQTARGFDVYGHALVAWDGSPQAEAALQAAVPLLQCASAVTLVEVDDGSIKVPATEAAAYLSRHGIKPLIQRESSASDFPSTVLLDTITRLGAAYLVMGGFGHSRLVEGAFGGVTKRMLRECPVPVFLAR